MPKDDISPYIVLLAAFAESVVSVAVGVLNRTDRCDIAVNDDLADGSDIAVSVLDGESDFLVSHDGPFQLPRGDCHPLSVWRARLRVISYITRDEVLCLFFRH